MRCRCGEIIFLWRAEYSVELQYDFGRSFWVLSKATTYFGEDNGESRTVSATVQIFES